MSDALRDSSPSSDGPPGADVTADEAGEVDRLCDEFEAQLRGDSWPDFEGLLQRVEAGLRSRLLVEALRVDRHWRHAAAEPSRVRAELIRRLPDYRAEIESVWGEEAPSGLGLVARPDSLGPYRDLEKVGEGSFGVVYRAWDSRHGRVVALKMPRFGFALSGEDLERFLREAKAAGSLDHPGIARVWDSGRIAGVTYIAYQFIEGRDLKSALDDVRRWPVPRLASFARRLATAVHYAHAQGIIHRDIKPSNVMITSDDRPVLTDFGLALAVSGEATRSLAGRVGTLEYMSPEQAGGDSARVDGRADVWSLGVLVYELLTGLKPFDAASDVELLRAILEDTPRRPRTLRRDTPRDLDVVVMRCLEKRRDDRLSNSELLAEELGRVEHGEPVISRPVSLVEQQLRWCRRNPRPVSVFSVLLATTAFGAWSWGGWVNENREREVSVQELQIEIESQRARRRLLLSELMQGDAAGLSLSNDDLEFVEATTFREDAASIRQRGVGLLTRADWFTKERFPAGSERHGRAVRLLSEAVDAEGVARESRERIEAALGALR